MFKLLSEIYPSHLYEQVPFTLDRVIFFEKIRANFSYEIRSGVLRWALEVLYSYKTSYFNLDSETPGYPISISSVVFANRKNLIL